MRRSTKQCWIVGAATLSLLSAGGALAQVSFLYLSCGWDKPA
jgi:hypothetical protein